MPDFGFHENQGGAAAITNLDGTGRPELVILGGRWYPTLLALADGRILAVSGYDAGDTPNEVPEIYKDNPPGTIKRSSTSASLLSFSALCRTLFM